MSCTETSNENEKSTKEKIINWARSQIEAHNEFKAAYNKQLAFDFNWFNFFNVGENKISEILKYFLDPNEKHAQGDVFLAEFLNSFCDGKPVTMELAEIRTEKLTSEKRRIDLYIRFKSGYIVAIENKVWAKDQQNQIQDYSNFLKSQSNDKYKLLFLSPYGRPPELSSIQEEELSTLEKSGKFKIITYSTDVLNLLDTWISKCEADNVSQFLKQLKRHFKIYFLGNDILKITTKMEEFVHKNQNEVKALVKSYNQLQNRLVHRINKVGKTVKDSNFKEIKDDIKSIVIEKAGPFDYENRRVFKVGLSHGINKIWIHISQRDLDIVSTHYFEKDSDPDFEKNFNDDEGLPVLNKSDDKNNPIPFGTKSDKLIEIFFDQVNIAIKRFQKYLAQTQI